MTSYLKDGELLWPTEDGAFDIRKSLPVGTYTVGAHPMKGWFLKPVTSFKISGKVYGKTPRQADRILNTFKDRSGATGVLLNGEKGSGKTMLAKLISQKAAEEGISTIVINEPFTGDSFNTFIQSIDEPCVIIFDEFEKVFDNEQQERTLTLLDGVYPTKKLFILTVNDKYKVNTHMRNRPGRIFYMLDYSGLDADFITEYCQDNLNNKSYITQVSRLTMLFDAFNFDMLKALVEEMNRYDESPNAAMEMLNAKPHDGGAAPHTISVYMEGKQLETTDFSPTRMRGVPLAQEEISIYIEKDNEEDEDDTSLELEVTQSMLKRIDPELGSYTYVVNEGTTNMAVVVITRDQPKVAQNWLEAF